MSVAFSSCGGPLAADAQLPRQELLFGPSGGGPLEGEMANESGDSIVVSGSNSASGPHCGTFGLITRRSRVQITPPLPASANSGSFRVNSEESGAENTAAPDPVPFGGFSDTCRHASGKDVSGSTEQLDPRLRADEVALVAAQIDALTDRSAGPDACWPWLGRRATRGYGGIRLRRPGGVFVYLRVCRLVLAAKVARPLRRREVTRHRCDNPICVNPAHLEPGSNADNTADKIARGRMPLGSQTPQAKLTEDIVLQIFNRLGPHARSRKCARVGFQYGVSVQAIYSIVRGLTWNQVTGLPRPVLTRRLRRPCSGCGGYGHNVRSCQAVSK